MKHSGSMHINPAHKGLFTKKAHAQGMSVGEAAEKDAHAGGTLGKEANFARMARRHWKPLPKNKKKKSHGSARARSFGGQE